MLPDVFDMDFINFMVFGQNSAAGKMMTLLDFEFFFEKSKNSRQIIGTHRRSISHAPKSSQMPYTTKINTKSTILLIKLKIP